MRQNAMALWETAFPELNWFHVKSRAQAVLKLQPRNGRNIL